MVSNCICLCSRMSCKWLIVVIIIRRMHNIVFVTNQSFFYAISFIITSEYVAI